MKNKRIIVLLIMILGFAGIFTATNSNKVQASYLSGNNYASLATRHVVVTRTMPVYRCKTGHCEAENRFYHAGHAHKGTKIYISRWLMSTGGVWVIKGGKYYHNHRTFFVVPGSRANWYQRI
ncbi:hypothetical protein [uncultured Lactobacillus sp.]|uniref:hypothetical protein n=1 Tax=uncultured Lactobacillus sp. TaxID=153152 RepID=UPI002803AD53|nr:hypothetical protein [uncultured Lactobacillus sp.]